jgi:TolB-like protein/class 3 adenylate cyclase/Tfp pilus assembly protein PilF
VADSAGISRILTLVFTDLADSTALKRQRGDQPVEELIGRHREQVRQLASQMHGRVVDWAGDGCFLTFETPSAAVTFALRLQQAHAQERDLPGVRVGIHMGEVSEHLGPDGDATHPRVDGLAVDLAARISGLARSRQILMSSAVADSARQRLDGAGLSRPIRWQSYGSYSLKGFDEPLEIREVGLQGVAPFEVPGASEKATPFAATRHWKLRLGVLAALVGAITAGLVWWVESRLRQPNPLAASQAAMSPAKKSIAVLPFVNMSSDKENEYFSDGITEELITALSKVSGLRVAARTSSFAFKGKNEPIESISKQLHVGAVLEGSVAKAGNRVRITAQLINAADGYHLWSDSYDRELADVFAVRSQVAETVAKELQVTLGTGEIRKLEQKPTEDLEAYQLYLKGRRELEQQTDFPGSLRYFQQAIARDPNYALAYLGLAEYYYWVADWTVSSRDAMPRSREAAEKALELDPSLAEAHVWLGIACWWYDRDVDGARREFQKALAMRADLASAHMWYGLYLTALGQPDEGIAESQRAVEDDPLSFLTSTFLGANLYYAGRNDEAIQRLRTAVALSDFWWARMWLGRAHARAGRFPEAISELRDVVRVAPFADSEAALGRTYAEAGNGEEATKALNHLRTSKSDIFVSSGYVAVVLIGLGRLDEAFAALEQAEDERWYYGGFLKVDPYFDPLRSDPRFKALLKKAGLEK